MVVDINSSNKKITIYIISVDIDVNLGPESNVVWTNADYGKVIVELGSLTKSSKVLLSINICTYIS